MKLLFVLFGTAAAYGATIPGLYNTGTDAFNVALLGGDGIAEIHYAVAGFSPVTYKNAAYIANDADSRWISSGGDGGGTYIRPFRLTFDLTGLDPSTASISGTWGADNCGTINLNTNPAGNAIGAGGCINTAHFTALQSFFISSGFVAGINHLYFNLENGGGPGAIRVDDIAGTARVLTAAVPEPSTFGLLGAGLVALGFLRRKR